MRPRGARQRAVLAVERLKQVYPEECELDFTNPFELLIATILSAQSTDKTVNRITPEIRKRWPGPAELAGADPDEIQEVIKPTGFFREKTKAIVGAARALVERYGGEVPPKMEDLTTLPGVGRKTANVVLGVAFGVPGFAVDTHVKRLTKRLGLTDSTDAEQMKQWYGEKILHGRRVCFARQPACERCVLNDFCPSSTTRPSNKRSRIKAGATSRASQDRSRVRRAAV